MPRRSPSNAVSTLEPPSAHLPVSESHRTAVTARYSVAEEIAHAITHGVGLLLSVAALTILVVFATLRGDAWHTVSCSIYGSTLVLLYAASTFYHALPAPRAKSVFRVLDHAAIYLLIAGTYTPFTLVNLRGGWGWSLFAVIWGLAIGGIVLETVSRGRLRRIQLLLYLVMGWGIVGAARPLLRELAPTVRAVSRRSSASVTSRSCARSAGAGWASCTRRGRSRSTVASR